VEIYKKTSKPPLLALILKVIFQFLDQVGIHRYPFQGKQTTEKMRFSTMIFATLCATATALDFTCDRDDVAVCCKGRDDEFEKCNHQILQSSNKPLTKNR